MTSIHFIGQDHENGQAISVYHLSINGHVYTYNRATDKLHNVKDNYDILRENLPGDMVEAFHQAWNPDAYAAAMVTPPLNEYGLPEACEDPSSPLYNPAKPQGEPVELQPGYVAHVNLDDLIYAAMAVEEA